MDKGRVEMWMIGRMDTGVFFGFEEMFAVFKVDCITIAISEFSYFCTLASYGALDR